MKTHTMTNGQTLHSELDRPYVVRLRGKCSYFGSYKAAERRARELGDGAQIFFDETRGYGFLIR